MQIRWILAYYKKIGQALPTPLIWVYLEFAKQILADEGYINKDIGINPVYLHQNSCNHLQELPPNI